MKPTLNEEIGMSQEGIDYVNSLEVKYDCIELETSAKKVLESMGELSHTIKEIENQRIKRQGRNALICVLIIIVITFITNYFNN